MNVVITGANRGLGLGFVKHYLAQGADVWACYRTGLDGLANIQNDKLHMVQLDVSQDFDASSLAFPDSIDLLINNAGIYGPYKSGQTLEGVPLVPCLKCLISIVSSHCAWYSSCKTVSLKQVESLLILALRWAPMRIMEAVALMPIGQPKRA
jgi:NAD(P)-dependent dehydrogenase (short-subunit alcohol dehydrogenase family)